MSEQNGMFGATGSGDTSGYGGLVRTVISAGSSERPFGSYFDQVADDLKYTFELRGQFLVRTYSTNYSKAYDTMLDGQVERRMRCAVQCVGDYWYSAWVDAGMPDLSLLCIDEKMKIDSGDYQFNGSAVLKGVREEQYND